MCETHLLYLPQRLCMISLDVAKFHDFQTSFAFFGVLKSLGFSTMVVFPEEDVRNLFG
jgi:hypothetical protein